MHRSGNNSIGQDLLEELETGFRELAEDKEVRVVILASEYDKYFSVGADLMSLGGSIDRDSPDAEEIVCEGLRQTDAD